MEGRKLLLAYVFNGWQEIAKTIVANIIVPWIFEILFLFTILYMLGAKRHALFNIFLSQKRQPI